MNATSSNDGMSSLVRTVCGWLKAFILLYGIQIVLYGHLTPGGGFAGGVVAASAFVLILLAEGKQRARQTLSPRAASTWDCLGVLSFLLLATAGLLLADAFFANFVATPESTRFTLFSGGIIAFCNVGIGLKVCSSLYLAAVVLTSVYLAVRDGRAGESS